MKKLIVICMSLVMLFTGILVCSAEGTLSKSDFDFTWEGHKYPTRPEVVEALKQFIDEGLIPEELSGCGGAFDVGDDIRRKLQLDAGDFVIRAYICDLIYAFADIGSFDEYLAGQYGKGTNEFYITYRNNELFAEYIKGTEIIKKPLVEISYEVDKWGLGRFLQNNVGELLAENGAEVTDAYLLFPGRYDFTAMYYKTTMGDFVEYQACLFPVDKFCELQAAIKEKEMEMARLGKCGGVDIASVYDTSKYRMDSPELAEKLADMRAEARRQRLMRVLTWVGIAFAAAAVAGACVYTGIHLHKKRHGGNKA